MLNRLMLGLILSFVAMTISLAAGPPAKPAGSPVGPVPLPVGAATDSPPGTEPAPPLVTDVKPAVLPSGVKIYHLQPGVGEQPRPGARVTANYRAWQKNGTFFDSSFRKGRPQPMILNRRRLLRGLMQGVLAMRVGGRARLDVPAVLAYGDEGFGDRIPPGTDMIYEVELLSIDIQPPLATKVVGLPTGKTETGVEYWDITIGSGPTPTLIDRVRMNATTWLEDGTFVTSTTSARRKQFVPVERLMPGWRDGILTMKPGGKRRLAIPPDLAYGQGGRRDVPPNASLVMEVDLLAIKPPTPQSRYDHLPVMDLGDHLRAWDLQVGDGEPLKQGASCNVHYTGWLKNGGEFASSSDNGKPSNLLLKVLPRGWYRGMLGMKPGGKRRLEIPADLAYGERGQLPLVPRNADLVLEIALVDMSNPSPPLPPLRPVTGDPTVTATGIKYWDLKVGDGPQPGPTDSCTVHYTGWTTDGIVFDTTVIDNEPFTFSLAGGVIKGWLEGVKSMRTGGRRRLQLPPDLAYGKRGNPPQIPPNATLIFEIELLKASPAEDPH